MNKRVLFRLICVCICCIWLVCSAVACSPDNPTPVTPTDMPTATPTEQETDVQKTAYGTMYIKGVNGGGKAGAKDLEPLFIQPRYERGESVVALLDVVEFGADPTGVADSSAAILKALRAISLAGGGTLWFPEGYYRVTTTITVPELVTIKGEYVDPDKATDGHYGAVLLLDIASEEPLEGKGSIVVSESAGIDGLTVYYPGQNADSPKLYPYTFLLADGHLRSLKNVTMLNSYCGIFIAEGESPMLENVKGTVLKEGLKIYSTADVGSFNDVTFSPRYWASIPAGLELLKPANRETIQAWSLSHDTHGMTIRDVEQQEFTNITLEGYVYGIFFAAEPTRFMGSGFWYNTVISDCTVGIYADEGYWTSTYADDQFHYKTSIDWRCGYTFSGGSISGTQYAVWNNSSSVKDANGVEQKGYIRFSGTVLQGEQKGKVFYTPLGERLDLSGVTVSTRQNARTTGNAFYYLYNTATAAEIQAALDEVGKAGGGIVYLCAGSYKLDEGLTVPANTELLGAAASPHRLATRGTRFYCRTAAAEAPVEMGALVTLAGTGAGVSGIFFLYDENIISINADSTYAYYVPAVRGIAQKVFAVNLCIAGANDGIIMENADGYFVKNLFTGCINTAISLSGDGGMLCNSLNNGTVMFRTGVLDVDTSNLYTHFFTPISLQELTYIKVGSGENQTLVNVFSYGMNRALDVQDAEGLIVVNFGTDNCAGILYDFTDASALLVNPFYTHPGTPLRNTRSSIRIYNGLTDRDVEPDIVETYR